MNTAGYPVASMVNAKGMVDEQHPNYIGTYWGQVSSAYAAEIVESADAYLASGPTFNDYTTCGWTLLLKEAKVGAGHGIDNGMRMKATALERSDPLEAHGKTPAAPTATGRCSWKGIEVSAIATNRLAQCCAYTHARLAFGFFAASIGDCRVTSNVIAREDCAWCCGAALWLSCEFCVRIDTCSLSVCRW